MPNKKDQKGTALVVIIITIAVMMIFGAAFLNAANYTYMFSKLLDYSDSTYFAANAASKRWISFSNEYLVINKYTALKFRLVAGQEDVFAKSVMDIIANVIKADLDYKQIVVNGDMGKKYTIEFRQFEVFGGTRILVGSQWYYEANVGITSVGDCYLASSPTRFLTSNKRTFYLGKVRIPFFLPMKLSNSVLSIGDVMVKGNGVANIYGDVQSFGSFPSQTLVPKQYYYGGVMAMNNATLNVFGNVNTRGFVRTGAYMDTLLNKVTDPAIINVSKDIIAQGISTFSKDSQIYAYRNALVLDDVEINGENSVIGVNGNFIGLGANTLATTHDENSAIINSSALHYLLTDSSTSRVVINGDIAIGGAGFKVDTSGIGEFEIESVGLIYPAEDAVLGFTSIVPTYKYTDEFLAPLTYIDFLKGAGNPINKFGYVTIIQAQAPVVTDFVAINGGITTWKNNILAAKSGGPLVFANIWGGGFTKPAQISGLVGSTIVGANDGLYWDNALNPVPAAATPINRLAYLPNNFELDTFVPSEIAEVYQYDVAGAPEGIKVINNFTDEEDPLLLMGAIETNTENFWKNYWNPEDITDWNQYVNYAVNGVGVGGIVSQPDYINVMKQADLFPTDPHYMARLQNLKVLIETKLNRYAARTYPILGGGPQPWDYLMNENVNETIDKIVGLRSSGVLTAAGNAHIVISPDGVASGAGTSVARDLNTLGVGYGSAQPYLFVNMDSNVDVEITGAFMGIVLSKGRIIMRNGGSVQGAIMATGRNKINFDKSLSDINYDAAVPPNITGYNLQTLDPNSAAELATYPQMTALNNGDYSGILFDIAGGSATVDFYMGNSADPKYKTIFGMHQAKEDIITAFEAAGVEVPLYQIF